ncbi:hypothetical protein HOP50_01g00500 [Chloropicon primus]|uniref:Uncharacterized protein n=1 Tax=Chloropicon primus TaxID=1764295 RepID=A0A5B8MBQ7_9CHLO|nr:hypothetical protein A3770_01p00590 [Chloropicon primus]UPQ96759.1 hypothetical protein HOP50_01g00500 [Chloropicon primus]|eukprot:QDZ17541.1 hypothetical protein A3770_01p00590 [Chloropicon primus]
MAFVSRSKRETKGLTEQNKVATLPLVGPGSYINIDKYNTDHGYAPFSSTAERGLNSYEVTDGKPGPGFYEKDVISPSMRRKASSNAFVSRVSRFAKENAAGTKQTPGPGTYSESNKWLKNSHQRGSLGLAESGGPQVIFQKQTTAPSVPARNQCYGYEVGEGGDLVRQAPPGGQYTGHRTDAVGPADYNPQFTLQHRHRLTDFSRSSTKREIFKPKKTPGPGQYQLSEARSAAEQSKGSQDGGASKQALASNVDTQAYHNGAMRRMKKNFAAQESSNFASKVPRMPGEKAENATPGPGSYHSKKHANSSGKKTGSTMQNFGSMAKRPYEVETTTQYAAPTFTTTPGPGAYDVNTRSSVNIVQQVSLVEPAPFASSSIRFGSTSSEAPGPGAYYSESGEGFVGELSRKIVARNGAFGCSTQRFVSTKSSSSYLYMGNDESPGPGQYIPDAPREMAIKMQKGQKKATSSFASNVHRFKPNRENAKKSQGSNTKRQGEEASNGGETEHYSDLVHSTPPPGAYSTIDPWDWAKKNPRSGVANKAFISKAKRFTTSENMKQASSDPGPGSYDTGKDILHKKFLGLNKNRSFFVSSATRFNNMTTLAPGPGTYDTEDPERTMLKRSFNVTIDGVEPVS